MRNTECTIYIATRRGRAWCYRKDAEGWTQTGPTGTVRRVSAEQLLSHILPPLAAGNAGAVSVRVESDLAAKTRAPRKRARGAAPGKPA